MDTSETYIKMCDCEEIQYYLTDYGFKERLPRIRKGLFDGELKMFCTEGDWIVNVDMLGLSHHAIRTVRATEGSPKLLWLPRQDQLQILSGLSWYLFDKTCVTWATTNPDYQRESKEIVGLRVVMHTINKKRWVSDEWILDKTTQ